MSLVITALYLLRGSVRIVLPHSTIVSTESASDERGEVTKGSYVRGDTCGTVRTTTRVVVSKEVSFVLQVLNVVIMSLVISSVLYRNVHKCTYILMCLVLIVLIRAQSLGPESKSSSPDHDRINIVRAFATSS